jgi:hypothetical protein
MCKKCEQREAVLANILQQIHVLPLDKLPALLRIATVAAKAPLHELEYAAESFEGKLRDNFAHADAFYSPEDAAAGPSGLIQQYHTDGHGDCAIHHRSYDLGAECPDCKVEEHHVDGFGG